MRGLIGGVARLRPEMIDEGFESAQGGAGRAAVLLTPLRGGMHRGIQVVRVYSKAPLIADDDRRSRMGHSKFSRERASGRRCHHNGFHVRDGIYNKLRAY